MSKPLSQDRLAEIRAAEQAATPPPWRASHGESWDDENDEVVDCGFPDTGKMIDCCEYHTLLWEDAQFCALARTAVPELLAEVERLWADNDRLRLERSQALSVTTREGLLASEWVMRTGAAEARVAELEALIADHAATCDEWCSCCGTSPMQRHTDACQWNQAARNNHARNHRARVEGGRVE